MEIKLFIPESQSNQFVQHLELVDKKDLSSTESIVILKPTTNLVISVVSDTFPVTITPYISYDNKTYFGYGINTGSGSTFQISSVSLVFYDNARFNLPLNESDMFLKLHIQASSENTTIILAESKIW